MSTDVHMSTIAKFSAGHVVTAFQASSISEGCNDQSIFISVCSLPFIPFCISRHLDWKLHQRCVLMSLIGSFDELYLICVSLRMMTVSPGRLCNSHNMTLMLCGGMLFLLLYYSNLAITDAIFEYKPMQLFLNSLFYDNNLVMASMMPWQACFVRWTKSRNFVAVLYRINWIPKKGGPKLWRIWPILSWRRGEIFSVTQINGHVEIIS